MKIKKKKTNKQIVLTEAEIRKIKREAKTFSTTQGLYEITKYVISAMVITLHDQYGFGSKRLANTIEKVLSQITCIDQTITKKEIIDLSGALLSGEKNDLYKELQRMR